MCRGTGLRRSRRQWRWSTCGGCNCLQISAANRLNSLAWEVLTYPGMPGSTAQDRHLQPGPPVCMADGLQLEDAGGKDTETVPGRHRQRLSDVRGKRCALTARCGSSNQSFAQRVHCTQIGQPAPADQGFAQPCRLCTQKGSSLSSSHRLLWSRIRMSLRCRSRWSS